jgi:DNA polymerase III subunit alpha
MIKSGAMDAFGPRERLMATMDDAITGAQKLGQQRASGQSGLFGAAPVIQHAHELREAEPWLEHDRLAGEYATLGFYVSGHPLARYADRLQELRAIDLASIDESKSGAEIAAAGIIVSIRPMRSRKGQRWAIFTLQDMSGIMEALAFPETFARSEQILKSGAMLLVRGRVQIEDAGTRIITSDIKLIDDVAEAPPSLMRVALDMSAVENQLLDRLEEIFRGRPGGCSVAFDLVAADGTTITLDSKQHVRADRTLIESVRGLCGPDSVLLVREAPPQERAAWR